MSATNNSPEAEKARPWGKFSEASVAMPAVNDSGFGTTIPANKDTVPKEVTYKKGPWELKERKRNGSLGIKF